MLIGEFSWIWPHAVCFVQIIDVWGTIEMNEIPWLAHVFCLYLLLLLVFWRVKRHPEPESALHYQMVHIVFYAWWTYADCCLEIHYFVYFASMHSLAHNKKISSCPGSWLL
jgi:hypothetical protein